MTNKQTEQETKQNSRTVVDPAERSAEIEEASSGLDPSFLVQKSTKLSKWQIDGIQDYKRVGLSLRETAKQLGLPPSTIYHYFKTAPGPVVIEKDSPGPSKLGQAPVVPLDNNGKEKGTSVVVTEEVTEPKQPDGAQSTQTNLSSANNGGVEIRQKNIGQDFPIDTREKITIKIDPDFILDVRGYMQHSGFKGNADDMRKHCAGDGRKIMRFLSDEKVTEFSDLEYVFSRAGGLHGLALGLDLLGVFACTL